MEKFILYLVKNVAKCPEEAEVFVSECDEQVDVQIKVSKDDKLCFEKILGSIQVLLSCAYDKKFFVKVA